MSSGRYKRILLKVSGEAFLGDKDYGINPNAANRIAQEIRAVQAAGTEVCLVVGGGNMFRGLAGPVSGIDRVTADYMGMLATVMNALALQCALNRCGAETRVMSAIPMEPVCERYDRRRALNHLAGGRIVIFAAGSGNPYFTTDTAAALRASEMDCNVILKGTKVDGVYSADPVRVKEAKRYDRLSYMEVLKQDLKVMDTAAIALAREAQIPILVFCLNDPGMLADVLDGKGAYTIVTR